jgi:putative transposase
MRNLQFAEDEFYHIFNRGVDKRDIFNNKHDLDRFIEGVVEFNTIERLGNIDRGHIKDGKYRLVDIVAYCLNPNHYHLILRQIQNKGIEKFMHKIGMGYTKYFNIRNKRSGSLFQGTFKAVHIETNEQLLHTSTYVNLNNKVHHYSKDTLYKSSWNEYINDAGDICSKEIVIGQFRDSSEYKRFAENSLKDILQKKETARKLENESFVGPTLTLSVNKKK